MPRREDRSPPGRAARSKGPAPTAVPRQRRGAPADLTPQPVTPLRVTPRPMAPQPVTPRPMVTVTTARSRSAGWPRHSAGPDDRRTARRSRPMASTAGDPAPPGGRATRRSSAALVARAQGARSTHAAGCEEGSRVGRDARGRTRYRGRWPGHRGRSGGSGHRETDGGSGRGTGSEAGEHRRATRGSMQGRCRGSDRWDGAAHRPDDEGSGGRWRRVALSGRTQPQQHGLQALGEPRRGAVTQRGEEATLLVGGIAAHLTGDKVPVESTEHPRVQSPIDVRADLKPEVPGHLTRPPG